MCAKGRQQGAAKPSLLQGLGNIVVDMPGLQCKEGQDQTAFGLCGDVM
jgi:hypothetical protein